ncbi:MAG: hypothetical protein ACLPUO_20700 [Streptosporangiaceae bacterium]|jgi:hypothetical protein
MMADVPPKQPPRQRASADSPDPDDKPALPLRSMDETDTGWGERPEPDDDERLRLDRPPHWDGS